MVGAKIKALKIQRGWTSQTIADRANLPVDTINKIISGSTKNPNADTLKRIASAFEITVDQLLATEPADPTPVDTAPKKAAEDITAMYERQIAQLTAMYERQLDDARDREKELHRRHERQFFGMLLLIIALIAFSVYLIVDALHGNWGIFQYADIVSRITPSTATEFFPGRTFT